MLISAQTLKFWENITFIFENPNPDQSSKNKQGCHWEANFLIRKLYNKNTL